MKTKMKGFYKRFLYKRDVLHFPDEPSIIMYYCPKDKEVVKEDKRFRTIGYDDLEILNENGTLELTTWRFRSKTRAYFEDFTIRKETAVISFKKNYLKGIPTNYETNIQKIKPWTVYEGKLIEECLL